MSLFRVASNQEWRSQGSQGRKNIFLKLVRKSGNVREFEKNQSGFSRIDTCQMVGVSIQDRYMGNGKCFNCCLPSLLYLLTVIFSSKKKFKCIVVRLKSICGPIFMTVTDLIYIYQFLSIKSWFHFNFQIQL